MRKVAKWKSEAFERIQGAVDREITYMAGNEAEKQRLETEENLRLAGYEDMSFPRIVTGLSQEDGDKGAGGYQDKHPKAPVSARESNPDGSNPTVLENSDVITPTARALFTQEENREEKPTINRVRLSNKFKVKKIDDLSPHSQARREKRKSERRASNTAQRLPPTTAKSTDDYEVTWEDFTFLAQSTSNLKVK